MADIFTIGKRSRSVAKVTGVSLFTIEIDHGTITNVNTSSTNAYYLEGAANPRENVAVTLNSIAGIIVQYEHETDYKLSSASFDFDVTYTLSEIIEDVFADYDAHCDNPAVIFNHKGVFTVPASNPNQYYSSVRRSNPTSFLSSSDTCQRLNVTRSMIKFFAYDSNVVDYIPVRDNGLIRMVTTRERL